MYIATSVTVFDSDLSFREIIFLSYKDSRIDYFQRELVELITFLFFVVVLLKN